MRIAQISPLFESVPPKLYGGTERIVHFLTEELVAMGHQVTLFASGDSQTSADLVPLCEKALRLSGAAEPSAPHLLALEAAFRTPGQFDVIHSHVDYLAFPYARHHPETPMVATLHGRLDIPELAPLYREYSDARLVSISDSQRVPLPGARWMGTVLHGLPEGLFRPVTKPGRYLAFLGRVSPEKGLLDAIDIAIGSGVPLRIAAKVDKPDRDYFETTIRPRLSHPLVEFIGEIGEREKQDFLGNAMALVFPVDWPEPFGLVMIEAMACGTPVIARRRGSVPEVVRQGAGGFVFERTEEAVEAVRRIPDLSRTGCRRYFEERFTARRMAEDYLAIYRKAAAAADPAARRWRGNGGGHPRQQRVLYPGQLLPGGEAEQGPQGWGDLRRLRSAGGD